MLSFKRLGSHSDSSTCLAPNSTGISRLPILEIGVFAIEDALSVLPSMGSRFPSLPESVSPAEI